MPRAETAAARAAVVAEAITWVGTPYHHHGRIKGVGVDCAMVLAEVFHRCGLVPHVDAGFYPTEWHLHRGEELFLGWLSRVGAQPVEQPLAGDIAVYRFGRCFSHGAIFINDSGLAAHSYIGRGVIKTAADEEPLAGRPRRCFTLFKAASA